MQQLWRENSTQYLHLLQERAEVQEKRSILQQRIMNLKKASEILENMGAELSDWIITYPVQSCGRKTIIDWNWPYVFFCF